MSNNNKTPAIRFKGFTDTWEQRELGDVCQIDGRIGFRGYTEKDIIPKEQGGVLAFTPTNIVNNQLVLNVKNTYITRAKYDESPEIMVKNGNILFVKTGSTLGKSALVTGFHEDSTVNPQVVVIKTNISNQKILSTILTTDKVQSQVASVKIGGAVPTMTETELKNIELSMPVNEDEKIKIGTFFTELDRLITLHQRKCDKLIQFKAAMLKKMFPQNGADKPELRFKGFTDAWEQRKLGELMEITSVKRIHQSDWTDSGVRFLRARDIVAVSKNEEVSEPLFISQEKYDEYSALSGKVKIGDLLVTGVGTIGVPMLINNEEPLYFKDGNIIWFKNEDRIDGEFFYHSFNGSFIQNFIKESAGIGTVGTYTIESGKKTPILLPTQKDEQQKIGTFFSQLDTLITLHQRKCDKYKSIKAGLIRKFFP